MAKIEINRFGSKIYLNDAGLYHREDGPATIDKKGSRFWYVNGLQYSKTFPSDRWCTGEMRWHDDNYIARQNGVAMDFPSGYKAWSTKGKQVWPKL